MTVVNRGRRGGTDLTRPLSRSQCDGLTHWLAKVMKVALTGLTAGGADPTTWENPPNQQQRQLAANSCLNYLPDGTQTFIARVKNSNGNAVSGVTVKWSDSDSNDAAFRSKQNPCTTGSGGTCSAELFDTHPRDGEKITVAATAGGSTGKGYLSFTR
jgi:Bacterial Ig-like domain (group 1)